jgi:ribosomal protein S19
MSRSKWKGPFIHSKLLKKKNLSKNLITIWSRSSTILSNFIGYRFIIYSGNIFKKCLITREKIGYKFGEFCTTRAKFFHKNKLKTVKGSKFLKKKK